MAKSITIASVQNFQVELLRNLAKETFIDTFAEVNSANNISNYTDKAFSLNQISEEYNHSNSSFFFAYMDRKIVGYLKLNTDYAQTEQGLTNALEVERIYARRSFQGKGVGKALMQKSNTTASEINVDWLWLGVWDQNKHAIEFYKRQGFEIFGRHDFFMGTELQHDILMKLAIRKA